MGILTAEDYNHDTKTKNKVNTLGESFNSDDDVCISLLLNKI